MRWKKVLQYLLSSSPQKWLLNLAPDRAVEILIKATWSAKDIYDITLINWKGKEEEHVVVDVFILTFLYLSCMFSEIVNG